VRESASSVVSTVEDSKAAAVLRVAVERARGGLTAQAVYPDGRPMLDAKGNLTGHNFTLHDASGAEVAKIHEAWASMHDAYHLDLTGAVDPVYAVVFAVLIDRQKVEEEAAAQAAQQHHRPMPHGGENIRL